LATITGKAIDGIRMSKEAFANYDKIINEVKQEQGYGNHQMDEIVIHINDHKDQYPNFDDFAHQKVAYKYGAYVGNPAIAGLFRILGETGQFVYYSADDITRRIIPGGEKQGMYQPYGFLNENGGLIDSRNDINNVINGARGMKFDITNE
jgi:hypothetical protein